MDIVPATTPQTTADQIKALVDAHQVLGPVVIVGIRGYYKDTMGVPKVNDIGIYDDALFISAPDCFVAFNANTDPSVAKPGVACLKPGVWSYKVGIHGLNKPPDKRYTALVQAKEVTVIRDGDFPGSPIRHTVEGIKHEDTGMFGINIHRGGYNTTSSLGCQTIYPKQWDSFIATVQMQLKRHNQVIVPYILTET